MSYPKGTSDSRDRCIIVGKVVVQLPTFVSVEYSPKVTYKVGSKPLVY